MQLVASKSGGFIARAENETERALFTQFTSDARRRGKRFAITGSTYECDYSAVTSFSIGWMDEVPKMSALRLKLRKLLRRG